MPLEIVRNDITKMNVDAIVNAANETLLGGGGVDGCIHRAAGPELLAACRRLGGCRVGDAKITGAYRLPCSYVIHTVGPVWNGGSCGEREQLASCYRTSLALAKESGCKTVAFPLIASGVYGYPKDQALRVAVDTIGEFLLQNDMTVYLVIFDRKAYQIGSRLFAAIAEYIDDHYVDAHTDFIRSRPCPTFPAGRTMAPCTAPAPEFHAASTSIRSLDDLLIHLDAGFSETLLHLIDRSGQKARDQRPKSRKRWSLNYSRTSRICGILSSMRTINKRRRCIPRRRSFLRHWIHICRIFNPKTAICAILQRAPVRKSMAHTVCSVGRKIRS